MEFLKSMGSKQVYGYNLADDLKDGSITSWMDLCPHL